MKNSFKRLITSILVLLLVFSAVLSAAVTVAVSETAGYVRELKEGDAGEDVIAMQERLQFLGYYSGITDGVFGSDTTAALIAFQRNNDLLASGILDAITFVVLFSEEARSDSGLAEEASDKYQLMMPAGQMGSYSAQSPISGSFNTNEYDYFQENRFLSTRTSPLSTFAADVDTASYAQIRAKILKSEPVPIDSVRIEEMINYFHYDYKLPEDHEPFGVTMELSDCPWNAETQLLLIGLQAAEIPKEEHPAQNLVFLIDVSGSMDMPNKLPLVKRAFQMLVEELAPTDTVSIVTYASRDEIILDGIRASDKTTIMAAIDSLTAGGMTAGAAGILTAYQLAGKNIIPGGNNRVVLATDGDLNVGISDEGSLARLVEEKKQGGIFLSVLGFGDGNYKDNKLEALADRGDGNYSYIDTIYEARRALVTEIGATFFTVAKDVKFQVDFNPIAVKGYRLIGYENRLMAAEYFADDAKDGGELGSGHRVTVMYELVPAGSPFDIGDVESKYHTEPLNDQKSEELLTLNIRAKAPDGDISQLYTYPLVKGNTGEMSDNMLFAAAVAEVGMVLRVSEWKGSATYNSALSMLRECDSVIGDVYKEEFLYLVTLLERSVNNES